MLVRYYETRHSAVRKFFTIAPHSEPVHASSTWNEPAPTTTTYPAQHDSLLTSLSNVNAASLSPSAMVR